MSLQQRINRLRRELTPEEANPVIFVTIEGDPHAGRLSPMVSEREAMIGDRHFRAEEGEPTATFYARLKAIYRESGARGCVILGHPSNATPPAQAIFSAGGEPLKAPEAETLH